MVLLRRCYLRRRGYTPAPVTLIAVQADVLHTTDCYHDSWYTTNDPWYYHERSVVFFLQKKQKDLSKIINTYKYEHDSISDRMQGTYHDHTTNTTDLPSKSVVFMVDPWYSW